MAIMKTLGVHKHPVVPLQGWDFPPSVKSAAHATPDYMGIPADKQAGVSW